MKIAVILAFLALGGCAQVSQSRADKMQDLAVRDALAKYEQASRAGDPLDMCVKAKLVAGAYAEAGSPASAGAWRAREREACVLAARSMGVQPPSGR